MFGLFDWLLVLGLPPVAVSFVPNPGGADGALLGPVPMPDDGDGAAWALPTFVPVPAPADPAFAPPPDTNSLAMTAEMTKGINIVWGIGRSPLPNH
jgi:hypothetical protein